jgi:hypothetical protein
MGNWSVYNKSLVRQGEVILDLDVVDSWYSEFDSMNNGKECTVPISRFLYPTTKLHQGIFSSAILASRRCSSHGTCE